MSADTNNGTSGNGTTKAGEQRCPSTRYWYVFISSSLITFAVGLILIVAWKTVKWCWKTYIQDPRKLRPNNAAAEETGGDSVGWMTEAKDWAGELLSGQRKLGRLLVSLLISTCSYVYIY